MKPLNKVRKKWLPFVTGVVMGGVLVSGIGVAANSPMIDVHTKNLNYVFFGEEQQASDKEGQYYNGEAYVPSGVIYEGTTYVPLRFVGESLGYDVGWNGETGTITVGEEEQEQVSVERPDVEDVPDQVQDWVERSRSVELGQSMTLDGKTYLLVTRGEKSTGGYTVDITGAVDQDNHLQVNVDYADPAEGDSVTQAITHPYALAVVNESYDSVKFNAKDDVYIPTLKGIETLATVEYESPHFQVFKPEEQGDQVVIKGVARVFEAAFQYEIKNGDGDVVDEGNRQAEMAAPNWGYFELQISADHVEDEHVLELFTTSAKDGSKDGQVEIDLATALEE